MQAVQQDAPGAILMDTGPAALWGILEDTEAAAHSGDGLILVNVGNQRTLGVLLQKERILGLFEHHTVLMTAEKLGRLVEQLRAGSLTNEAVYEDHGHGAFIFPDYSPSTGFESVAATGPERHMAADLGYHLAAPYGDMMLNGCFGLVAATRRLLDPCKALASNVTLNDLTIGQIMCGMRRKLDGRIAPNSPVQSIRSASLCHATRSAVLAVLVWALVCSHGPIARAAEPVPIASYTIEVTLDTDAKTLTGHEIITYVNTTDAPIADLVFIST